MDIQKISHAEPNWEVKVNENFNNLIADTGWNWLPVLAPFEGKVMVRRKGSILEVNVNISRLEDVSSSSGIPVASIPLNMLPANENIIGLVAYTTNSTDITKMIIDQSGTIAFLSTNTPTLDSRIRFDKTIIC